MEETRKDRIQLLVRRICLIITDILLVNGCVFLSLLMRFEISISAIPEEYLLKYSEKHDSFYDCCHYYILVFQNVSQFMAVCQHCGTL